MIFDVGCGLGCDLIEFIWCGYVVVGLDGIVEFVVMVCVVSGCEVLY